MYSRNNNSGAEGYLQKVGEGIKRYGVGAAAGMALLASVAGCGGVKTVPHNQVPQATATSYERLAENPALKEEFMESCKVQPGAFSDFMNNVFPGRFNYGSLGHVEKKELDAAVSCPENFYLPNNFEVGEDLSKGSLETLVRGLSDEEIRGALESDSFVNGVMYMPQRNTYIVIPEGDNKFLKMLNEGIEKKFDKKYGDFDVETIANYALADNLGTVSFYQLEGSDGLVIPHVDVFTNGYRVGGKHLPQWKIDELKDESGQKISHEIGSEGRGMEARMASATLTGAAAGLFHPVAGFFVLGGNIIDAVGFNNVASYINDKNYNPGRSLSGILTGDNNSSSSRILVPLTGFRNDLVGFMEYNINPSNKDIVLDRYGLNVEDSGRFAKGFLGDLARLGAAAGIYQMGKSDGKTIERVIEGPTGGAGRPDGSGPGVISR